MSFVGQMDLPPGSPLVGKARSEFELLAGIAHEDAGLLIPPEKAPMVFARLAKRLRALGMVRRSDYCDLLLSADGKTERRLLISTLTTNVTSFLREPHHFSTVARDILPQLALRARAGGRVRFWSAGCSSGPEPYSLAMVLLEGIPDAPNLDIRILATDIDPEILRTARVGEYDEAQLKPLSQKQREKHFKPLPNRGCFEVSPTLRKLVSFRELNLLAAWPMRGQFDAIFCRNVVIYFAQDTQNTLWPRFQNACAPGGYVFLGHSERLDPRFAPELKSCGTTTYRREDPAFTGKE